MNKFYKIVGLGIVSFIVIALLFGGGALAFVAVLYGIVYSAHLFGFLGIVIFISMVITPFVVYDIIHNDKDIIK